MDAPKKLPLFAQILIGMVAGAVTGFALGEKAAPLGEFGSLMISVIKGLAAPLLFFAVVDAFLTTEIRAKDAARLLAINALNATLALTIGLTLSNLIRPGVGFPAPPLVGDKPPGTLDVAQTLKDYVPTNLFRPFVSDSIISIILIAVLIGLSLRKASQETEEYRGLIQHLVRVAYRSLQIAIGWVIRLIPLAVFAVVAKTVGEHGFAPVSGLAVYLGVALLGIGLQVTLVYQAWILVVARMSLVHFWKGVREAAVYALGASSSLATLPVTLRSLDKMGVSRESSTLAACVGTNLNNDSILLYEAMAALFVAQAYGIDLSLGDQLTIAAAAALAGIGIAGVPDAGLISLALVLGTVGLPVEILPLLLTVDWILSRARATANVVCDFVVAILLDRFSGAPREEGGPPPSESKAQEA